MDIDASRTKIMKRYLRFLSAVYRWSDDDKREIWDASTDERGYATYDAYMLWFKNWVAVRFYGYRDEFCPLDTYFDRFIDPIARHEAGAEQRLRKFLNGKRQTFYRV